MESLEILSLSSSVKEKKRKKEVETEKCKERWLQQNVTREGKKSNK